MELKELFMFNVQRQQMEMYRSIGLAVFVIVFLHYEAVSVQGIFIIPEPQISSLSSWTSLQVDQVCSNNCYSNFDNISCSQSKVCTSLETCNGRQGNPPVEYPLTDWPLAMNNEGCRVRSNESIAPLPTVFFDDINDRTLIVNGSADDLAPCFSRRNGTADGIFTLVFWLMADCKNCSVLELPQKGKQSIHIRVIQSQICFNTECQDQQNIGNKWAMITVRVVRNQMAIFLNDAIFEMHDNTLVDVDMSDIYIGSAEIAAIGDIFRLRYIRYYRDALTFREIKALRTGMTDPTFHYEDCHCPADFPEEAGDNNCTNGISYYRRYNTTSVFNNASVTVDDDPNTYWASSDQGNVTLTLHFRLSFQIETIEVMFGSALPNQALYSMFSEGQTTNSGFFLCTEFTCRINMTTLNQTSTVTDLATHTADTIQIELHRQNSDKMYNFIISAINVTGRCDCSGNADNCTVNYENQTYACSCVQETHSLGQHCESCSSNFYRSSDQFDCPNKCQCQVDGVANISSQCEEIGGRCICKKNVEGLMCDACKPFSYKFGGSVESGCLDCACFQNNSLSCSNVTGDCSCKANAQHPCDKCVQYSYGLYSTEGCQPCNCNVAGTISQNRSCDESTGQCQCKVNVQGRRCDSCNPGFYGMEIANQQGCKPCSCHPVGTETATCDATMGQCHCRGGITTNENCMPKITAVDPTYGPQFGGTLVTISGSLLGNTTHNLAVFLSDTQQDLISVSDNIVVFRTMSYNISSSLNLKLSWKDVSSPFSTTIAFSYRENPVLDTSRAQNISTFVSGGCQVKIYGTNLQSVKYPQLVLAQSSNSMNRTAVNCRHTTDYVICPTPSVKDLYSSSKDHFLMTVVFDGISSSDIGNIDVQPDPYLDNVGTIRFQYPFEDTITLGGKGLRVGCPENEFTVLIGVVNCAVNHITDTEIECTPAVSPPGGYMHLPIQVIVGNFQVTVGTLHYLKLHETTGFIIIISCISAAVALVIAGIIIYICWRRRKNKAPNQLTSLDDKQLVAEDVTGVNTYSELPERTEDAVIVTNGFTGLIQKETIFQEPKKGFINTEAEDLILTDEFLPKVDAGLVEDIKRCFVGAGHFVLGRHCAIKGKKAQLIDGSFQKSGAPAVKLTIKSIIQPIKESQLPAWANTALSECLRLRRCKHKHVLNLLGIGVSNDQFHILYPHMSQYILKTMVSDVRKEFSVRQLIYFGQQVAEGITFLASKDITHKDVAARNCMVDELSVVKLSDAAFSWDLFENEYIYDEQRERYLPIRWMAPESITDGYYDQRTDVWSFAVLVWELLTRGCLPYHEATSSNEISNFIKQGYILGKPDILSENMYDLLSSCWSQENEHRPNIASVSKSLGELLKTEDDGTYANAGEVVAMMQSSNRNTVLLKQSPGGRSTTYSTSRLSRV